MLLPQDGEYMRSAKVVDITKNQYGKVIGEHKLNPIFYTGIYDVMFPDGSIQQHAANIIAEHMYSQVDKDGHRYHILE